MERLRNILDPVTMAILEAQMIDDRALALLTDRHLHDMGITQAGPRVVIMDAIGQMQHMMAQVAPPPPPVQEDDILTRGVFEDDGDFRNTYLYRVLDRELVPDEIGMKAMTKIACRTLAQRISNGGPYPDVREMKAVACQILDVFPHLEATRAGPTAPIESRFFWRNGGRRGQPHSGYIWHHVRYRIRKLPKDMLKFRRTAKAIPEDVSDELVDQVEGLSLVERSPINKAYIRQEMQTCFPVHKRMLEEKKTPEEILTAFPHLHSYGGLMLFDAFRRLHPDMADDPNLKDIFDVCLFLAPAQFRQVEDGVICGCLRLLVSMPVRGLPRINDITLSKEEELARPLIRWETSTNEDPLRNYVAGPYHQHPHIVCLAKPTKMGRYFVYVGDLQLFEAESPMIAIGSVFRAFDVLGVKVPKPLDMLYDFLSVGVYNITASSSKGKVQDLLLRYQQLQLAKQANAGPSAPR